MCYRIMHSLTANQSLHTKDHRVATEEAQSMSHPIRKEGRGGWMPCPGGRTNERAKKRVLQKRAYQLGSQLFEFASDGLVSRALWSTSVVVLVVHKRRHVKIGCNHVLCTSDSFFFLQICANNGFGCASVDFRGEKR